MAPAPSGAGVSELTARVIAIFGPTASGKSAVAEALTQLVAAEIVSADSMQVYAGVPILTNQPARPTRLVSVWPLSFEGSVVEYADLAHEAIDELVAEQRLALVVGGTGLYLRAAVTELGVPAAPRPGQRARLEQLYDRLGPKRAHTLLSESDPAAAEGLHPNDRRRVVRALELVELGLSLRPRKSRLWSEATRHPTVVVGLDLSPAALEQRIVERTRRMVEQGATEEARRALEGPISSTAAQIIGLRELVELPEDEAVAAIKLRTCRYAAYQRKWLRRIPGLVRVAADRPVDEVAHAILEVARTR